MALLGTAALTRDCFGEPATVDAVGTSAAPGTDQKPHVPSPVNDAIRLTLDNRKPQSTGRHRDPPFQSP